ncbi:MAG: DNA-directed RNA polymerase subunit omega [Rickettsiales bacterium]|jgi:DNA-directed RNA polymerase omega subunit|nr:DNA-directed RNA polymerase subunit omega [Rickettsiales bacterium]
MSDSVIARPISVEKCLDIIPNKFRLAIFVMNRAKDLQIRAKPDVEIQKFAKKNINRTLYEIKSGSLNIPILEEKIKKDILTNNLYSKNSGVFGDDSLNESDDDSLGLNLLKDNGPSDVFFKNKEEANIGATVAEDDIEESEEDDDNSLLAAEEGEEITVEGDSE